MEISRDRFAGRKGPARASFRPSPRPRGSARHTIFADPYAPAAALWRSRRPPGNRMVNDDQSDEYEAGVNGSITSRSLVLMFRSNRLSIIAIGEAPCGQEDKAIRESRLMLEARHGLHCGMGFRHWKHHSCSHAQETAIQPAISSGSKAVPVQPMRVEADFALSGREPQCGGETARKSHRP